jgi:hypothetical protein
MKNENQSVKELKGVIKQLARTLLSKAEQGNYEANYAKYKEYKEKLSQLQNNNL